MTEITLTPKQEKFVQVYIETGNATEAYRQAYNCENMKPESINRNAKAQLDNTKIASRINIYNEKHLERHNVTIDSLTKELEEAKTFAYREKQTSAAVSAIMGKAKIHGYDKTTVELKLPKVIRKDLSGKADD